MENFFLAPTTRDGDHVTIRRCMETPDKLTARDIGIFVKTKTGAGTANGEVSVAQDGDLPLGYINYFDGSYVSPRNGDASKKYTTLGIYNPEGGNMSNFYARVAVGSSDIAVGDYVLAANQRALGTGELSPADASANAGFVRKLDTGVPAEASKMLWWVTAVATGPRDGATGAAKPGALVLLTSGKMA